MRRQLCEVGPDHLTADVAFEEGLEWAHGFNWSRQFRDFLMRIPAALTPNRLGKRPARIDLVPEQS